MAVDDKTLRMPPPTKLWGDSEPKYAATRIIYRDCAGQAIDASAIGVIEQVKGSEKIGFTIMAGRFRVAWWRDGALGLGSEAPGGFDRAKNWTLFEHLAPRTDRQVPTGETWEHWLPWWRDWAARLQPRAGSVVDVRNFGMLKEGCCNRFLVREL